MQNKYDDDIFFEKYSGMLRSEKGLEGAGEWETLRSMLPNFAGKNVLDLGCGFGWHCLYAAENGADRILGLDISEKMLAKAQEMKGDKTNIEYARKPIEEIDYPEGSFDVVISSLAFHYVNDFDALCGKIKKVLTERGDFVFSVEHPIFTAQGSQDWAYDDEGNIQHWPVDNYFYDGEREAIFLGEKVVKYHRSMTTYFRTLIDNGFEVMNVAEPMPSQEMIDEIDGMRDEMRRPMMLIVSAKRST